MPRQRKSFDRPAPFNDASLVVIASEGFETEFQYFTGMRDYLHSRRINLIPIQREAIHQSAPIHIVKTMDDWVAKNSREAQDRLFIVVDRDRWGDSQLAQVARICKTNGYELIVSNPCFELWLLLHFEEMQHLSSEITSELMSNPKVANHVSLLKRKVQQHVPGFSASHVNFEKFSPFLRNAIANAKLLEDSSSGRWPISLGTRVHIPVEHALRFEDFA